MVKEAKPQIVWSNKASISLKKAHDYIKEESPANAKKVIDGIFKLAENLTANPERHPPDKFKKNNPGNYRAFEKYSFRIAYKHTKQKILILRVRHVKQEPKEY
jgi:plasmid stabilization system protein ParE